MIEIFQEAARILSAGERGAIATIIATIGSTPGKTNSKMLVRGDGSTLGTVGGGCTEEEIRRLALQVIATDRPHRQSFRITAATASQTGLLCGGEFEVYIEPIGNPVVYIFGAGHIARALVPLLASLDYRSVVIDDREAYAAREHFPLASEVRVADLERALDDLPVGLNSYLVVVTRGHQHDEAVLAQAVRTTARYVGVIGSRGKIGAILRNLKRAGIAADALARVRGPIGLDIDARSPAEIAIAIAAEMIAFRRGVAPPLAPCDDGR
ncbi:MAG: XdhC/CoxI family protein [Planctomycetes bacterium]|nr:XdhC/CoxI family protein [Planctomycetota bacterium]